MPGGIPRTATKTLGHSNTAVRKEWITTEIVNKHDKGKKEIQEFEQYRWTRKII